MPGPPEELGGGFSWRRKPRGWCSCQRGFQEAARHWRASGCWCAGPGGAVGPRSRGQMISQPVASSGPLHSAHRPCINHRHRSFIRPHQCHMSNSMSHVSIPTPAIIWLLSVMRMDTIDSHTLVCSGHRIYWLWLRLAVMESDAWVNTPIWQDSEVAQFPVVVTLKGKLLCQHWIYT